MTRDTAKSEVKKMLPTFLQQAKTKVNGRATYICPRCGNGSGADGDGIVLNPKDGDGHYKCFVCGLYEDIIGLWKAYRNIDDDAEAFNSLYEYYGLQVENSVPETRAKKSLPAETAAQSNERRQDNMDYLKSCMEHIRETDYPQRRGLSEEIIQKFMLGYDPHFKTKDKITGEITEWQALIIPSADGSYVARNTDPEAPKENKIRKNVTSTLYCKTNLEQATEPVFIVEGELDALSIIDSGGVAVGLGSTANCSKLINALKSSNQQSQPLILALDNDESGQNASRQLANDLQELGIPFYKANIYGEAKDANEALLTDREALKAAIADAKAIALNIAKDKDFLAHRADYLQTSAANYLQRFIDGIAENANSSFIPTGFHNLDSELDGGLYPGLYILGAISSLGKTTFAVTNIADQIAESGRTVCIFSLEMSLAELMAKSISRLTLKEARQNEKAFAKTTRDITTGSRYADYCESEKFLIQQAENTYAGFSDKLYISEGFGEVTVDDIRKTVEQHINFTGEKPVVIVDYLQMLAQAYNKGSDKMNADKAVLELKRLSRDFSIPVIAISSFNRNNYNLAVSMEAFKESGGIEYSADVLIGLQLKGTGTKSFDADKAKTDIPRKIEAVILKNRNGRTGGVAEFKYYCGFNDFEEA